MFSENSIIVKSWVELIRKGTFTRDQVPALGNLQEVVFSILDKEENEA
nr:MAG TPA: hypothetical protein [Caudoviricetes sp.]